jgi:hypothetical protein
LIQWLDAWPFGIEALSGIFDFNHAPFFLSFMEVRVERSKRQVVPVLNGLAFALSVEFATRLY